jgi:topoisomerase-4 subunit A
LKAEGRGNLLGSFKGDDKILSITPKGEAKLLTFDLSNRFDDEFLILEKWKPEQAITCIYFDGEKNIYFIKRFLLENNTNIQNFMPSENPKSFIEFVGTTDGCVAEIIFAKDKNGKTKETETLNIDEFIGIKGLKAMGNQFIKDKIKTINIEIPEEEIVEEVIEIIPEKLNEEIDEEGAIGNLFDDSESEI